MKTFLLSRGKCLLYILSPWNNVSIVVPVTGKFLTTLGI